MKEFVRVIDDNNTITYRIGENQGENHTLIDEADKSDWWFHLDNIASCHCIVERTHLEEEDIIFASTIVAENSSKCDWKNKNIKKVRVCYIQVKNLKKTKNPGEVLLLKNPSIFILKK